MEFLRFIFSGFWVWLGFVILTAMVGGGVIKLVKACKRNRKVEGYRIGERWHIEIENASAEDARSAIISAAYAPGDETKQEDQDTDHERAGAAKERWE